MNKIVFKLFLRILLVEINKKQNNMKKQLLLLLVVFIAIAANGQISVPNGDFENWTSSTYNLPDNYPYTSNVYSEEDAFNLLRTTDAHHGGSAVKLVTNFNGFGYFLNCDPKNGDVSSWAGGMAYNQKPTGIRGYYKYNVNAGDVGVIIATFRKAGVDIGTYYCKVGGVKNDYTLFNFTFSPALTETPDAVIFGAVSSDFTASNDGLMGSTLYLDSVSFTGVNSQPALMNGDFETWTQGQTPYALVGWPGRENQAVGVSRTIDVPIGGGKYALQLTTTLGNGQAGNSKAQNGFISTGVYDPKCNCMKNGHPFANQIDTLAFWYKSTQMSTGKAEINMIFTAKGKGVSWMPKILEPSTDYKYMEFPFSLNQVPDSVVIQLLSSAWQDSLVAFVGCELKIDNLHFKSQKANTGFANVSSDDMLSIYPNPSNGKILINGLGANATSLEVFNIAGIKLYSASILQHGNSIELDLSSIQQGIYLLKISDKVNFKTKRIVIN